MQELLNKDTAMRMETNSEEYKQAIKLDGIFMPHTRRQRDEAYNRKTESGAAKKPTRFVHYTSADAALRIIQSKRIWMRNTNCMADYREVQHGHDIVQKFFADEIRRDKFITTLDRCAFGVAIEAIGLFDQWWNDVRVNTYIASISEHDDTEDFHGRLSMWRAFGGNAARVAIVLNIPWNPNGAAALSLMFSPVVYMSEEETHAVILDVINNIENSLNFLCSLDRQKIVGSIFNMLLQSVTCLKHTGFREEREWRAIYSPERSPSQLMEKDTEVIGGIPQPIYKLPLDVKADPNLSDLDFSLLFDRIIIGPSQYPWVMYKALTSALSQAGIPDSEGRVVASQIPIRS